ncbi:hypothetical protein C0J52_22019 [Blattella germanica]|nr:hypothetical protein C0J52_22019 [Blattella germanica]
MLLSESEVDSPQKKRCSGNVRQLMKEARNKGEEFVTDKGRLVERKTTGAECGCKKQCTLKFHPEEDSVILHVYSGRNKNERDCYLMGFMERRDVIRHRPKNEESKQITSSYKVKDNFNYRFGRPQVDVCSLCEELQNKINSTVLNDAVKRVATAELLVHKHRAKKFYVKLNEITTLCKDRNDTAGIVFDYMQNLPLPLLSIQEMFYLRKLWHMVFCVHKLADDKSVFYTYHEGTCKKGPDEVCSFVMDFVTTCIPPEVQILHVFSDACGGQNRNHTLIRLFLSLTTCGRFQEIHQYFPVRGHSFLPCDRDFAIIKKAVHHHDRIYTPLQYNELIKNAKKKNPVFEVRAVETQQVLNYKEWWTPLFKKTTKSVQHRADFQISQYRQFIYRKDQKGFVDVFQYIGGLCSDLFKLSKVMET